MSSGMMGGAARRVVDVCDARTQSTHTLTHTILLPCGRVVGAVQRPVQKNKVLIDDDL